jgi:hypothetical protein
MVSAWWLLGAFLVGAYAGVLCLALLMMAGRESNLEASATPASLDGLGGI